MFSKRHYEFLAQWIAEDLSPRDIDRREVAETLADRLDREGKRFNRWRFLAACKLDIWKAG